MYAHFNMPILGVADVEQSQPTHRWLLGSATAETAYVNHFTAHRAPTVDR
jgi:hypothetical protein